MMNVMPELAGQLKQLRLSGILDSLDARNRQAIDSKMSFVDFLALLIGDEVARREQKKFTMRLRRATCSTSKTFDQFNFERLPKLNRALVQDLAAGRYLNERSPILIVGDIGVGKSHLAQALGHAAIRNGTDCYRQSNTDPIDEVELTHLGEDGSFFEAADVDPGASSGDTSDGPTGRGIESDRKAGGMLTQHRAAVFAQRGSQAIPTASAAAVQAG
jgi:hypothetical protein